jgi:uncharacterized protein (DUF1499 family)
MLILSRDRGIVGERGDRVRKMSPWLYAAGLTAIVALVAAAAFWLLGPERLWTLFGPADLGPVSFETLKRQSTRTDALACPPNLCAAEADIAPPAYPIDVPALRKAFARALASERLLTLVGIDDQTPADRYVQRSQRMRFPDTIVVRYIALPDGKSTVAIYSRSQLGRNDLGVNLARIERWLEKLQQDVDLVKRRS